MSIYVMTVGELARKRGEPVGEFVKKVQDLGFDAGSHAKKLTQVDLDNLIGLLDGSKRSESIQKSERPEVVPAKNPNVLIIDLEGGKKTILYVDANFTDTGDVGIRVIERSTEDTLGEALLEFRKQLGMKLGVN